MLQVEARSLDRLRQNGSPFGNTGPKCQGVVNLRVRALKQIFYQSEHVFVTFAKLCLRSGKIDPPVSTQVINDIAPTVHLVSTLIAYWVPVVRGIGVQCVQLTLVNFSCHMTWLSLWRCRPSAPMAHNYNAGSSQWPIWMPKRWTSRSQIPTPRSRNPAQPEPRHSATNRLDHCPKWRHNQPVGAPLKGERSERTIFGSRHQL